MVSRRCATVFAILTQVARDKPSDLPEVFAERQGTVESSIDYLETPRRELREAVAAVRAKGAPT